MVARAERVVMLALESSGDSSCRTLVLLVTQQSKLVLLVGQVLLVLLIEKIFLNLALALMLY